MRWIPSTAGSRIFANRIAKQACAVYETLSEAGVVRPQSDIRCASFRLTRLFNALVHLPCRFR